MAMETTPKNMSATDHSERHEARGIHHLRVAGETSICFRLLGSCSDTEDARPGTDPRERGWEDCLSL